MQESQPNAMLREHLHARFREAFGPPHRSMGPDDHWQLRSFNKDALNVLLNGVPEHPAVWVFDLHERTDEVFSQVITTNQQVDAIIVQIQNRMNRPLPKAA